MNLLNCSTVLAALASATFLSTSHAALLLEIDLSIPNIITVTSTSANSSATISGSDTTGVYLADFYSNPGSSIVDSSGVGDFTNFLNPSDGTPGIFRSSDGGGDPGLNFWTFSSDSTVDFVAGTQAFTGQASWTVDPTTYAEAIAGGLGGDIYFAAERISDVPGATIIGQWSKTSISAVPEPSNVGVIGATAIAASLLVRSRSSRKSLI